MNLDEYLFRKKISKTDFAKRVGITRNYLSLISLGRSLPSKRLAKDIEFETGGEVTIDEILNPKE